MKRPCALAFPVVLALMSLRGTVVGSSAGACAAFPRKYPDTGLLNPRYRRLIDRSVDRAIAGMAHEPITVEALRSSRQTGQHCQAIQVIDRTIWVLWDPQGLAQAWNMSCCDMACGDHAEMRRNAYNKSFAHNALRLQSVLRLIDWIVAGDEWVGVSFELMYCGTDGIMPKSLADRYPVVKPLSCGEKPTVAWPELGLHRHRDLPLWDAMLEALQARNLLHVKNFTDKAAKAVFRGEAMGIEHTCGHTFGEGTDAMTVDIPNFKTWKTLGTRLKLIHLRDRRPDLLDVNLGHLAELSEQYGVDFSQYELDGPAFLPMETQYAQFRMVLSVGRKNCWADRLRYLLMSPCLVLLQTGRPCKEYWEIHLQPYIHYVPVDAELNNLTAAIEWANSNVQHAQRIVRSANKMMYHIWSLRGVYYYARSTLHGLASLTSTASRLPPGSSSTASRNNTDRGGLGISGVSGGVTVEKLEGARRFRCFDGSNCIFGEGSGRSVYYNLDRPRLVPNM